MGIRQVLRVALDFDWPTGVEWKGYLNPYEDIRCVPCDGLGSTNGFRRLDDILNILFDGEAEARAGTVDHGLGPTPRWCESARLLPGGDYVDLCERLAVHPEGIPRASCRDNYSAREKILRAVGLDEETWGVCPHCEGECVPPEIKVLSDGWSRTDPPAGDGYQAWSFSGQGMPISPVFAEPGTLVAWLVEKNIGIGVGRPGTADEWLRIAAGETLWLEMASVT